MTNPALSTLLTNSAIQSAKSLLRMTANATTRGPEVDGYARQLADRAEVDRGGGTRPTSN